MLSWSLNRVQRISLGEKAFSNMNTSWFGLCRRKHLRNKHCGTMPFPRMASESVRNSLTFSYRHAKCKLPEDWEAIMKGGTCWKMGSLKIYKSLCCNNYLDKTWNYTPQQIFQCSDCIIWNLNYIISLFKFCNVAHTDFKLQKCSHPSHWKISYLEYDTNVDCLASILQIC